MVTIQIGNNFSRIKGEIPPYASERLWEEMSYVKQGGEHTPSFKSGEWDGVVRLFEPGTPFLSGLLNIATGILKESNVEYQIHDRRKKTHGNFAELEFNEACPWFERRPYANFTVDRCLKRTRGILNIGTGGGKTVIVAELIGRLKVKPFLFYVRTKDLLYQAKDVLRDCLNVPIGQIGDGKLDIQDITVCTVQSLIRSINSHDKKFNPKSYKYDADDVWSDTEVFQQSDADRIVQYVGDARGLYFDEVHHASSKTSYDTLMASKNAYWRFGGTATVAREDGEELVTQGLFGRNIVKISASYLIREGFLVPPYIFFVPVVIPNALYRSYPKIYKNYVIENDPVADTVASTARYLVSKGKSSLILVSKIKHGKRIHDRLPEAVFLTGKDNSIKRTGAINAMRDGSLKILIATTLADEGLDIKNLDAVHMVGSGASITRVPQRIGRVIRKASGKSYGIGIYYHYCTKYLYDHGQKTKRLIKSEPEFQYVQTDGLEGLKPELVRLMNSTDSLFF